MALRGFLAVPESPDEEKARVSHCVREPEPISLVITSLRPPKNPHIIEAVPKEGGQAVRVRVRHNANFLPGMEIRARPDEQYPDVYVLVGADAAVSGEMVSFLAEGRRN